MEDEVHLSKRKEGHWNNFDENHCSLVSFLLDYPCDFTFFTTKKYQILFMTKYIQWVHILGKEWRSIVSSDFNMFLMSKGSQCFSSFKFYDIDEYIISTLSKPYSMLVFVKTGKITYRMQ